MKLFFLSILAEQAAVSCLLGIVQQCLGLCNGRLDRAGAVHAAKRDRQAQVGVIGQPDRLDRGADLLGPLRKDMRRDMVEQQQELVIAVARTSASLLLRTQAETAPTTVRIAMSPA